MPTADIAARINIPARAKSDLSPIIDTKSCKGVTLHQQGKFADATRLYQEILRQTRTHFDALHLLGVVALQTGRHHQSVDLITQSITINPDVATTHANLDSALMGLQRVTQALQCFEKAVAVKP